MRRAHLASGLGLLLVSALGFKCPQERPTFIDAPHAGGGGTGDGGGGVCVPVGVELPTPDGETPVDEDCDGDIDEPPPSCDEGVSEDSTDPLDAARALELCSPAAGLANARWTRSNGTPLASPGATVKLARAFGANIEPQRGDKMLVLSTGRARDLDDSDACDPMAMMDPCSELGQGTPPPGYPAGALGCPAGNGVFDDVGLELDLVAPPNAGGFSFRIAFASLEFPEGVCSDFNDQLLALVDPPPSGAIDGNVVFDDFGSPLSSLFNPMGHCDPQSESFYASACSSNCPAPPADYCSEGPAFLAGTGFDVWNGAPSGATGWLETEVPVSPGESFTIRFTVFDTSDEVIDSTGWIDRFEWRAQVDGIDTDVVD